MAAFFLLLLPAVVFASIDVQIAGQFDGDHSNMKVYYYGSELDIISDQERDTFNLGDRNLKNGVRAYFGKTPSDAYVRSPTPWGDLYNSYGWSQVMRALTPKSARVLSITSEPLIVMQQIFENNSSKPATFNVGISQAVENKVSSLWSKSDQLSIGQELKYKIDIDGVMSGGATSISYTNSYGEKAQKTTVVTVGATSAMQLLLQPGQTVVAELQATKGTIKVEVEYEASLSGSVAVDYDETYRGHYFWGLDVRAVMSHGNLSNKLVSREVIEIGFYANSKVEVSDREMNYKMLEVQF